MTLRTPFKPLTLCSTDGKTLSNPCLFRQNQLEAAKLQVLTSEYLRTLHKNLKREQLDSIVKYMSTQVLGEAALGAKECLFELPWNGFDRRVDGLSHFTVHEQNFMNHGACYSYTDEELIVATSRLFPNCGVQMYREEDVRTGKTVMRKGVMITWEWED